MRVELLLHPAAERNRSMLLYAKRLQANQPAGQDWHLRQLPTLPTRAGYRLAELVLPPLRLPFVAADAVHVIDHAHAAYLRYLRRPSVVTVHDLIVLKWLAGEYPVHDRMPRAAAGWYRWNIGALAKATSIVCPSQATANDLKRLLGLSATVVPHGVDDIFFADPDHTTLAHVADKLGQHPTPTLLQVSAGPFYKNELAFMETFVRLAAKHSDLTWVRVGEPLLPRVRQQLGSLAEYVIEFGAASAAELAAIYRRASLLLFPSWDEGFGWPPLEAMAAGCPVVCSHAGALAETAVPAALSAAPDDIGTLANYADQILGNETLRTELVERGKKHAATFTWVRAAETMKQLYAASA